MYLWYVEAAYSWQAEANHSNRANKAQFSDVSLRHIVEEDDVLEVSLPSVQGIAEDAGELSDLLSYLGIGD